MLIKKNRFKEVVDMVGLSPSLLSEYSPGEKGLQSGGGVDPLCPPTYCLGTPQGKRVYTAGGGVVPLCLIPLTRSGGWLGTFFQDPWPIPPFRHGI